MIDVQNLENKLIKTKEKSKKLKTRLYNLQKNFNSEARSLNREIQNLKEQNRLQWDVKNNPWFILFIVSFIGGGIYGIFKLRSTSNLSKRAKFKHPK